MPSNEQIVHRLQGYLATLGREYQGIWRKIDFYRPRFRTKFTWPEWCFMPMAGFLAILTDGHPDFYSLPVEAQLQVTRDAQKLAALAPWRLTQGIYRFHPELEHEIASTKLTGDLPTSLFYSLPEWCVYIHWEKELPEATCHGFFAHLEWDANHKRPELRLLVNVGEDLVAMAIHLKAGTIEDALEEVFREAENNIERHGLNEQSIAKGLNALNNILDIDVETLSQMVSLVLYLCSINADINYPADPSRRPRRPMPKKIKKGELRYFPAERPMFWHVAYRIGERIARLRTDSRRSSTGGGHASPRPHIRRAHWHSYWVGPRKKPEKRYIVVKWLHPILVAGKQEDIVPTISTIRKAD